MRTIRTIYNSNDMKINVVEQDGRMLWTAIYYYDNDGFVDRSINVYPDGTVARPIK